MIGWIDFLVGAEMFVVVMGGLIHQRSGLCTRFDVSNSTQHGRKTLQMTSRDRAIPDKLTSQYHLHLKIQPHSPVLARHCSSRSGSRAGIVYVFSTPQGL